TVPLIAAWHLRQIQDLLRESVILTEDGMWATARGIAGAFESRPSETLGILEAWLEAGRSEPRSSSHQIMNRERLLATVALAFGLIRSEGQEALDAATLVEKLRSLLEGEDHPYIRRFAFVAMRLQAVSNFDHVSRHLQPLIGEVTLADRGPVLDALVSIYLHQRRELAGFDSTLQVGGEVYGIWWSSKRPSTSLEAFLFQLIDDDVASPVARQVATQAF